MGVSTNGQVCYGYLFEDGYEFPWGDDVERWWRNECEFVPTDFPYTPDWNDLTPPASQQRKDAYFDKVYKFDEANPMPFELVNVCSVDYPTWILAVPNTVLIARRGYPEEMKPEEISIPHQEALALKEFIEKYGLTPERGPAWWLSSCWG